MPVAALYDIHGNLPALEAVLADVANASVDRIVIGGDVVFGPMSRGVLQCLLELTTPLEFIRGNADTALLEAMAGRDPLPQLPTAYREALAWEAAQLLYQPMLAGWPPACRLHLDRLGDVLFCHATPRDENEVFLESTPADLLLPIFAAARADVVVCGHTHMPFDRAIGATRVVNAGSVGMAVGETGASWLLLGESVALCRTSYDLTRAAERIRGSGYPQAEMLVTGSVLSPPSLAAVSGAFAKVAIG